MEKNVAVIGGGIAGLGAAYSLKKMGISSTVFEMSGKAGGRMTTEQIGDYHVDVGASYIIRYFKASTRLTRELGMKKELKGMAVNRCAILRDGVFHTVSLSNPLSILMFKGLSWKAKREVLGIVPQLARNYFRINDFLDPFKALQLDGSESAYDYAVRMCGREIADYLLDPLNMALCQYSVRELSRLNLMNYFLMLKDLKLQSPSRGIGSVPERMARDLDVVYRSDVKSVQQVKDRVEVTWENSGTAQKRDFAAAVVAVWGDAVPKIVRDLNPVERAVFDDTRYSTTTPVVILLDRPVGTPFQSAYLAPGSSDIISAFAIEENKGNLGVPKGKGCLFCLTGESWARATRGKKPEEIGETVAREASRFFPNIKKSITGIHTFRWDRAVEKFQPGRMALIHGMKAQRPAGSRVFFAGSYLLAPTTDAGYTTGARAAQEVAAAIG